MNETILIRPYAYENYSACSGIIDDYCKAKDTSLLYNSLIILILSIMRIYFIRLIPEKYRAWVIDTSNVMILSLSLLQFIFMIVGR